MKYLPVKQPLSAPRAALTITGIYAFFAAAWILFSDRALVTLFHFTPEDLNGLRPYKGWVFVTITSVLLYMLIRARIRDQQRWQSALARSERQYRLLIDTACEGVWLLDRSANTAFLNDKMANLLGYKAEEMLGQPATAFLEKDVQVPAVLNASDANQELRLRRRDGRTVWATVAVSNVSDAEGDSQGTLVMVNDISDRKSTEHSLYVAMAQFESFMQNMPGIAYARDREGRLTYVGGSADGELIKKLRDNIGCTYEEMWPADVAARARMSDDRVRNEREIHQSIETYPYEDGPRTWLINRFPIPVSNGQGAGEIGAAEIHVGAIAIDISKTRQAEERVEELNQKLEERVRERTAQLQAANEAIDSYSYSVSHDLRTPIKSMSHFAQDLLREYGHSLDEAGRTYLLRIVGSAARVETLIGDLLEFSRSDPANAPREPVSLILLVTEVIGQLQREFSHSSHQVTVQEPLPWVMAHRATLARVVTNLVRHGLTAEGTRPDAPVRIWAETIGSTVRLWIEDTAPASAIIHSSGNGNGDESHARSPESIGLALARKGVVQLGGRFGNEQVSPQGNRFWIELPAVVA